MKTAMLLAAVLFVGNHLFSQDTNTQGTVREAVTVRLLNGKTGKPIVNDAPNIWFDDAKHPFFISPKSNGDVVIPVKSGEFKSITIMPSSHVDCRFKSNPIASMELKYSLQEILNKGIVSENVCGNHIAEPTPGMLVIYARPMTFMEKLKL